MQQKLAFFENTLQMCPMFSGLTHREITSFLNCAKSRICTYQKGQMIIGQGDKVQEIGIMLCGSADAVRLEIQGRQALMAHIAQGQLFADLLAAGQNNDSPVTIMAQEVCTVCFVPWQGVLVRCNENCSRHTAVLQNLVSVFSHKFFELFDRIECLTAPNIEEKIMSLLQKYENRTKLSQVILPFDREQMAAYLGVDRSALSRQLGRMKQEGKITYYKNQFTILK